ncbi:MAG: TonB-dependent receptor [Myxococcota bacterium]
MNQFSLEGLRSRGTAVWALALGMAVTSEARAQTQSELETPPQARSSTTTRSRGGAAAASEIITISGTKKKGGESSQDAPVAVTAFGEQQLEAFQFRDVESLTFYIPNVSLDSVGTVKGVANFSIRGLGVNSSIPSIDPSVGLFVNGVYMASNVGAVLDSFDLEAVEVLRGPQGVLFGRNVTGGAVLLRTKRPGDYYSSSAKAMFESGLEYRLYGAVDAPLLPDLLKLRLSGQYRRDDGFFTNLAPVDNPTNPLQPETQEEQFGFEETWLLRPTVTLTPVDDLEINVMFEHGETDGQGPAAQSQAGVPSPGPFTGFDFSINEPGFIRYVWNQVFADATLDLGKGGQITNIFGWREVLSRGLSDIDSTPITQFHASTLANIRHFSNELRYANEFFDDFWEVTAGLYVFNQDLVYRENRNLLNQINSTLGGNQDQLSLGAFTQMDFNITDKLTAFGGLRFTWERKEAEIASFNPAANPCQTELGLDCAFDFNDDETWTDVSPKLGVRYQIAENNQVYGSWTQGFRSGGYNMRNTSPTATPGPFDAEQQNAFEIGAKTLFWDNKLRVNAAAFFTIMDDLQREVNVPDMAAGVVQIIQNTADANLYGFELDANLQLIRQLAIMGSFGVTDANYTNVDFDLNGDGVVDSGDEDLTLPRLANITANAGAIFDQEVANAGLLTLRFNYAYRDDSFFTDNNLGVLPDGHVIDASVAFTFADIGVGNTAIVPKLTLYGRNLANEAFLGGQTPLPPALAAGAPPLGGNFSPLKEGRIFGAELRIDWD